MKKVFYFVIMSIITFFTPKSPYAQNVFYGTVMDRWIINFHNSRSVLFILGFFAMIPLSVFSIVRWGKAKITFMDDGKENTKLCKIISSDTEKIVFKAGKKTYTLKPSEVIRIKKGNTPFRWLLALFIFLVLLAVAGDVVDYVTRPIVQSHIDHVDLGVYVETLE
jgi:hypothetical protein